MEKAGFKEIGVYITWRQNAVAQYITTRTIVDLCERSIWRPGNWLSLRWWEQEVLDLDSSKEIAASDLDGEE